MSHRRGVVAALASLLLLACDSAPPTTHTVPPEVRRPRDPVLLIHGWNGSPSDWGSLNGRMVTAGWATEAVYVLSYPSNQSNVTSAQLVKETVDRMLSERSAQKVDIVSHSMGALPSRHYIKFLGGDSKVDAWVSLAGPNHGTSLAQFCATAACVDMRPGSPFLTQLNAGDETPGNIRYATWWSACDEAIDPKPSVQLDGAQNTQVECPSHLQFLTLPGVADQVLAWLRADETMSLR